MIYIKTYKIGLQKSSIYEIISSQKWYYKKTDGGAEYLCTKCIEGTPVGDIRTTVIRLDGGAELM